MAGRLQRRSDILACELDDALMMLSIEQGRYYSADGAGPRIWQLLEQPTDLDAIVAQLLSEFEVTPEQCREETTAFLAALREQKLLTDLD